MKYLKTVIQCRSGHDLEIELPVFTENNVTNYSPDLRCPKCGLRLKQIDYTHDGVSIIKTSNEIWTQYKIKE